MTNDQSIEETLEVIRKALQDDEPHILNKNILLLNRKVNEDGTVNILNSNSINKESINKILDEKIKSILEIYMDEWLKKNLPMYLDKNLKNK